MRVEKTPFFNKNFPKSDQKLLFGLFFFQNFACGAENLAKTRSFQCFGTAQKINLNDLKKGQRNFQAF